MSTCSYPICNTVVENVPYDMILGAPQLNKGVGVVDFPSTTFCGMVMTDHFVWLQPLVL